MAAGFRGTVKVKEEKMEKSYDSNLAIHVSVVTIIVNFVLSAFKLAAGFIASSGAMISDAVHSASDVFSTLIVIAGVKISSKAPDKEHQYGHERMECVASIILAIVLAITGLAIGKTGVDNIMHPENLAVPGILAMVAAVISIAVKEWQYWYTRAAAKKLNSSALMADAWHHRSDALSSVGALIGILGARMGIPVLDPVASVVICLFILKAAFDVFKDSIDKLVDRAADQNTEEKIRAAALSVEGVKGIDSLRTRLFASKVYVDMEILVDGNLTLIDSHRIAEAVHAKIESDFADVKHIMVHVNPYMQENG